MLRFNPATCKGVIVRPKLDQLVIVLRRHY
jgi:hypothetical protein